MKIHLGFGGENFHCNFRNSLQILGTVSESKQSPFCFFPVSYFFYFFFKLLFVVGNLKGVERQGDLLQG